MLAALYRITVLTAVLAVLTGTPGAANSAHAAEGMQATTANGYTFGGAATRPSGHVTQSDKNDDWFSNQLARLSLVGSFNELGSMTFDDSLPVDNGGKMRFTPRNANPASYLGSHRGSGMLGLVYAAEKWQLGAGYATNPALDSQDPLNDRIDRYMLGTRYDAFGAVGFGASIELRDYNTGGDENGPDEKVFTFGTYVNF